jgi:integrase
MATKQAWPKRLERKIGTQLRHHVGTGQWYKTIDSKPQYFGKVENADEAADRYLEFMQDRAAGRASAKTIKAKGCRVDEGLDHWFEESLKDHKAGLMSASRLDEVHRVGRIILEHVCPTDRLPDVPAVSWMRLHRALARRAPRTWEKYSGTVRTFLKHCYEHDLVPSPVKLPSKFRGPADGEQDVWDDTHKRQVGTLSAEDIVRALWTTAETTHKLTVTTKRQGGKTSTWTQTQTYSNFPAIRAAILLGINCGFSQAEIASLRVENVDLENRCISLRRNKVGKKKIIAALWEETAEALLEPLAGRTSGLVFRTASGGPVVTTGLSEASGGTSKIRQDYIAVWWKQACRVAKVEHKPFSYFRKTFRTVADTCRDKEAVETVMGHNPNNVAEGYVLGRDFGRLVAVADHVKDWLAGETDGAPPASGEGPGLRLAG